MSSESYEALLARLFGDGTLSVVTVEAKNKCFPEPVRVSLEIVANNIKVEDLGMLLNPGWEPPK